MFETLHISSMTVEQVNQSLEHIDNIIFETKQNLGSVPVLLNIDISGRGSSGFNAVPVHLLPQEIDSLRLAQISDGEFSQAYVNGQLQKSHQSLHHYLIFRGFGSRLLDLDDITEFIYEGKKIESVQTDIDWKTHISNFVRTILVPKTSEYLLRYNPNGLNGFAAARNLREEFEVYEFTNFLIPRNLEINPNADILSAAYTIAVH